MAADHGDHGAPEVRATPQGLGQRSYREKELPKSERRKNSMATLVKNEMTGVHG